MKNLKTAGTPDEKYAKLEIRRGRLPICPFVLLFLLLTPAVHAQIFSVDRFSIDGGGTSAGGVSAISGTIGQPDVSAQMLTGSGFSLTGGFWSLFAVQSPGGPALTIGVTANNTALVSWPFPSTGFTLQQNADLNSTNWMVVPQTVSSDGTNMFIHVNLPTANRFYRLFKP